MLEKEDKKYSLNSDARNDLLAQALGKLSRTGHMQGLGKFIYASIYFHGLRGPIRNERERELDAWKKSVNDQLREIYKELKRTPRHLDVGSSTFPHNMVNDDDSDGDVHKVTLVIYVTEIVPSLSIFHCISSTD